MTPAWQRADDVADAEWDEWLGQARDATAFQSPRWAAARSADGWRSERWLARGKDDEIEGMLQVLVRRVGPRHAIGWAPGGPVLGFRRAPEHAITGLADALGSSTVSAVRIDCGHDGDPQLVAALAASFHRPRVRINTGTTTVVRLDGWRDRLSSHHRRNLRHAEKNGIAVRPASPEVGAGVLADLHAQMTEAKRADLEAASDRRIRSIASAFGRDAILLVAHVGPTPAAACLVVRTGTRAILLTGATNDTGRAARAGHAMFAALLDQLHHDGAERFDFGGLDPGNPRVEGVNRFKLGFGGDVVRRAGEWDWARGRAGRVLVNAAAWRRARSA